MLNVSDIGSWKRPGCARTCVPRGHDLEAHEGYGFHLGLLAARVEPVRRVETGPLVVDLERIEVTVNGKPVHLTPTEMRLLMALAERAGRTVPYADLLAVLGPGFEDNTHPLRVNVVRLRARLGRAADLLETIFGFGYRLVLIAKGADVPRRVRYSGPSRLLPGQWSRRYKRCVCCGKKDSPHNAHGRCQRCRGRQTRWPHIGPCGAPPTADSEGAP